MSDGREKGLLPFSNNIELQVSEPLDPRARVKTLASLTILDTWRAHDGMPYHYDGMITSVAYDIEENNGLYRFKGGNIEDTNNWEKIGNSGEQIELIVVENSFFNITASSTSQEILNALGGEQAILNLIDSLSKPNAIPMYRFLLDTPLHISNHMAVNIQASKTNNRIMVERFLHDTIKNKISVETKIIYKNEAADWVCEVHNTTTQNLVAGNGITIDESTGAISSLKYTSSFTNVDLNEHGIITVNHNLNTEFVIVQVYDNSKKMIIPDEITVVDANSISIDLINYGDIVGTYSIVVMG